LLSEIQGIETYSWLEKALLNKYYFYQIFNVLFVFIIGNVLLEFVRYFMVTTGIESLWSYVNNKPTELLKKFASSLTNMSPFYINYIMLQAFFILSIQLIYPAPIAKSLITWLLKFIGIRKTPRTYSNLSDPRTFSLNYGYISTLPLVLFTVTMTFSCICPIIPLLGTIYFAYSLLVYKYQLLYIQHPRYESYGGLVPSYIKRCIFAILIFQITMFGVLSIKLSVENNPDDTSSPNLWGFKTILYMLPLLVSSFIIIGGLNNLLKNILNIFHWKWLLKDSIMIIVLLIVIIVVVVMLLLLPLVMIIPIPIVVIVEVMILSHQIPQFINREVILIVV
jgi:hypothetical protein